MGQIKLVIATCSLRRPVVDDNSGCSKRPSRTQSIPKKKKKPYAEQSTAAIDRRRRRTDTEQQPSSAFRLPAAPVADRSSWQDYPTGEKNEGTEIEGSKAVFFLENRKWHACARHSGRDGRFFTFFVRRTFGPGRRRSYQTAATFCLILLISNSNLVRDSLLVSGTSMGWVIHRFADKSRQD